METEHGSNAGTLADERASNRETKPQPAPPRHISTLAKAVDYIRNLEMPEELQEKWGYKPITDETRAKILGLNLAKLAKIKPTKRIKAAPPAKAAAAKAVKKRR